MGFQSVHGLVVLYQLTTVKGVFCRDCGSNLYHEHQRKTLIWGWWWLVGVFVTPLIVLLNRIRARRFTKLDLPQPTPGVVGRAVGSLAPGRRLVPLPLVISLTIIGVPLALLALLIVVGLAVGDGN
jgi:hypothetical protein